MIKLVTRNWNIHRSSSMVVPPQDFIKINKLAIKMNAANYKAIKDFRKSIDIKQKVKNGSITKKIILPPDDFVYGKPNRPPTPIKEVINNDYGNRAEATIRNEYKRFIKHQSHANFRPPKVIPRYINPLVEEFKRREEERKKNSLDAPLSDEELFGKKDEKPLYKLKMFQSVGSKIAETIKQFKTYHPYKKKEKEKINDDGIDNLINKVQEEIKQKENDNKEKDNPVPA